MKLAIKLFYFEFLIEVMDKVIYPIWDILAGKEKNNETILDEIFFRFDQYGSLRWFDTVDKISKEITEVID